MNIFDKVKELDKRMKVFLESDDKVQEKASELMGEFIIMFKEFMTEAVIKCNNISDENSKLKKENAELKRQLEGWHK